MASPIEEVARRHVGGTIEAFLIGKKKGDLEWTMSNLRGHRKDRVEAVLKERRAEFSRLGALNIFELSEKVRAIPEEEWPIDTAQC